MPLWSLTMERVEALETRARMKRDELEALRKRTPRDLWIADLDALERELVRVLNVPVQTEGGAQPQTKKRATPSGAAKTEKKKEKVVVVE